MHKAVDEVEMEVEVVVVVEVALFLKYMERSKYMGANGLLGEASFQAVRTIGGCPLHCRIWCCRDDFCLTVSFSFSSHTPLT